MSLNWVRTVGLSNSYSSGSSLLGRLGLGQTYMRVRFRWGIYGDTTDRIDMQAVAANLMSFGLVTTVGDGTETPPNARTQSNDQSPPTQRWIYWETRQVQPVVVNPDAGVITWRDTGSTEPTETRGQVLFTGFAPGPTLNLWASWAAPFAWDPSGEAQVWFGASVLYKVP